MKFENKVVIVTGAAQGIGEAFAEQFSALGSKLVLGDISGSALEAVASRLNAVAVVADVSKEAGIQALIEAARLEYGRVDVFVSNAGILRGTGFEPLTGGPFVPDLEWEASWKVNVMAHVWAARHVLPEMVERGSGALIHVASAAGLLTEMGSQPYSVTKHAAVGFAEWLALHYRDSGIRVVCVCPQGVQTPMVTAATENTEHLQETLIAPSVVAQAAIAGLVENRFLVLPHPEVARYFQNKARDYEWWLGGMRKLKKSLWG